MTDQPFSALTTDQAAQVADLFVDSIFGSDPAAFVYEVNGAGETPGRRPAKIHRSEIRNSNTTINIIALDETHVTETMRRASSAAFDLLAGAIVERGGRVEVSEHLEGIK